MSKLIITMVIVLAVALAAGITIGATTSHHPDPTQIWISCINRQIDNPNIVCVQPTR